MARHLNKNEDIADLKRVNYREIEQAEVESPILDIKPKAKPGDLLKQPGRASLVTKASWLMRDAKEEEVRSYFQSISLQDGMVLLAQARKNIEIAATVLNQRLGEDAARETCSTCGGPPNKSGLWVMQGVDKDKDTGTFIPYRYCNVICVRERNKKKMLPEGHSGVREDGNDMGDIR